MGKRFDTLLFPGGKAKAFTLSYDDGVVQDRRLVGLCDQYGVKGTFNLGYGVLGYKAIVGPEKLDISKIEVSEVSDLYKNQEIGGHSLYHSALNTIKTPLALYEIVEDKRQLDVLAQKPIKMFAYPFGFFNDDVKDMLKKAGYQGARTVKSTLKFDIPEDFLEWNPTCHHNDEKLFDLAEQFINAPAFVPQLFYVWGHGYEFDHDKNWDRIEKLIKMVSEKKEDVWFASNGEIIDYINAYNRLEYSVDGSMIYNPSCIDVEILAAFGVKVVCKAGSVTKVQETTL